jgi:hypothetical protein
MSDTAAPFNQTIRASDRAKPSQTEPPVRKIVVVGGGTAGWMTAMLLSDSAFGERLDITVLESPQVDIIGVGEGSTPWMRGFFEQLGIEESEWMPQCNATYKSGITFDKWSTKPGFEKYFHPFASMLDNLTMTQFVNNVHTRLDGADVYAQPDRFFIAAKLARDGLAPKPQHNFPFDVWYGYHFDSVLLGRFLHRKAMERGVHHIKRHMNSVMLKENGDIASLQVDGDETIEGDFFVDCTGFSSLLIGKALKTPYLSFTENLFNDAAVALPTPLDGPIMSQTISTALGNGWAWKIPLTNRYGNGYVYSSAHCSADEAEIELRTHLGMLDDEAPARHLKMRIGRYTRHWNRNCVAIGLSQGFIEPLEATTLMFVQRTAALLVAALEKGDVGANAQTSFNDTVNAQFEGTRDYIVTHYKTNSRTDTDYWRANAANVNLSEPLQRLLKAWLSRRPIIPGLQNESFGQGYPIMSWYSLLAGMGVFPDQLDLRQPTPAEARHSLAEIDNLIERSAMNYPDHRELLKCIPSRLTEPTLQAYLW